MIWVVGVVVLLLLLLLLLLEELLLQLLVLLVMAVVMGRPSVDHAPSCMGRMNCISGVHAIGILQFFEIFTGIPNVDQSGFRRD